MSVHTASEFTDAMRQAIEIRQDGAQALAARPAAVSNMFFSRQMPAAMIAQINQLSPNDFMQCNNG